VKFGFANLLMLLVFMTVGFGLAKLALRFLHPQETMYPRWVASDDFRNELPRNARIVHRQGCQWEFICHTNALGRRGPYVPITDAYDPPNVVVLGDSFTFGAGVKDNEVYTQAMSRYLEIV
jgi:hypothetical protein